MTRRWPELEELLELEFEDESELYPDELEDVVEDVELESESESDVESESLDDDEEVSEPALVFLVVLGGTNFVWASCL